MDTAVNRIHAICIGPEAIGLFFHCTSLFRKVASIKYICFKLRNLFIDNLLGGQPNAFQNLGGGLMIPSISPAICAFNDNLTQTQLDLNSH